MMHMPRPRSSRRICFTPNVTYYKPRGIPMNKLKVTELTPEELEALRLKHVKNLNQVECAAQMHTSQSTFQRILSSAHKKLSSAVVHGNAIQLNTK